MTSPTPRNAREVADLIRADIEAGRYPRGAELPTQTDLAITFGVHQSTVSAAVAHLASAGLVMPVRGKRTIVTPIPKIVRNAAARYVRTARERDGAGGAAAAELAAMGLQSKAETRVDRVIPPARVAEILGTGTDEVVVRARIMFAGDTITQLADSYIPLDIAGGTVLEQDNEGQGGMISRMAELGFAQVRITEDFTGRLATAEEARALKIPEGQPVFDLVHVGWTAEGRAVEVALHTMPQAYWIIRSEFNID